MAAELDILSVALFVVGGFAAGFVNTVAGGGSAITIPLLAEFLGDARVANGTNRVAVLGQSIVGFATFQRGGVMPWKVMAPLVAPVLIGAGGGAYCATVLPADVIRIVLAIVMVGAAVAVLLARAGWEHGGSADLSLPVRIVSFVAIGFYGGLVQAGVGLPILLGLVFGCRQNLVSANAAKIALVLLLTLVALPVFFFSGQVAWISGGIVCAGSMLGAWFASILALRRGAGWIKWMVLLAAVIGAARMLFFR